MSHLTIYFKLYYANSLSTVHNSTLQHFGGSTVLTGEVSLMGWFATPAPPLTTSPTRQHDAMIRGAQLDVPSTATLAC